MSDVSHGTPPKPRGGPTDAELEDMTPEQLATLATELDDVRTGYGNSNRWPVAGHPGREGGPSGRWPALVSCSRRSRRWVFLGSFLFWPFHYRGAGASRGT